MIRFALSQEQIDIVERLVASGRFAAPDRVIGAALALLETRERERFDCLAALHEALTEQDGTERDGAAAQTAEAAPDDGASATQPADAPALSGDQPFDADALDEIEQLIARRAAVSKPASALV